ncbi:MAG: proton-conducting transporter membrane subunit, partial [bacterium]|nr:proton-conducting transporter membrane subunit [bacterium]
RASRAGAYATLLGLLTALALALHAWDRPWRSDTLWLAGDPLAAFADVLILCGAVLSALLAVGAPVSSRRAGTAILILLGTLGAMLGAGARDLLTLFVGLELSAISLLAYQALDSGPDGGHGLRAALRFAGPASVSTVLTAVGIACLWSSSASPDFDALSVGPTAATAARAAVGGGLLLAGLALRAGAVPFHLWLADVSVGSAPSAAMLTLSVGILPALIVLGRLVAGPLATLVPELDSLLMFMAVLSSTAGALLVLPQRRLRRLLGYAVLAHVGFILAGIATHAGEDPFSGTTWMQLAALLPAVAGCLAVSSLAGDDSGITASGLARSQPGQGVLLCLFLVALAGLPPSLAFAGRSALWSALSIDAAMSWFMMANGLVLAYGLIRFAGRVVFDEPLPVATPPATSATVAAAVLSAAVLLIFGLWPLPIAQAAAMAAGGG